MATKKTKPKRATIETDRTAMFSIGTDRQDVVEANAKDKFGLRHGDPFYREKAMTAGFVDGDGNITVKGWETLNEDIRKLENNAMSWLRRKFVSVRDDGHDTYDDLVGTVWYDPRSKNQREMIELGESERIDMVDSSYGDLWKTVWNGVSPFGQVILGGAINFRADPKEDANRVRERSPESTSARKRLSDAAKFFAKNAGYSYAPGESKAAARKRNGKALAEAEAQGETRGWRVIWEEDPEGWDSIGDVPPETIDEVLWARLVDAEGRTLGSLGSIIFGKSESHEARKRYGRVIEAELMQDALS